MRRIGIGSCGTFRIISIKLDLYTRLLLSTFHGGACPESGREHHRRLALRSMRLLTTGYFVFHKALSSRNSSRFGIFRCDELS